MANFDSLKSMSSTEIILVVIFVIYIVFPIKTPQMIAPMVDNPIGVLVIFMVTIYLFFFSNPVLGVLYIFVGYELIRRSTFVMAGNSTVNYALNQQYLPSQSKKNAELQRMNPPPIMQSTLEESVISKMAPTPHPGVDGEKYTFKPVSDKVVGASVI